MKTKKNQKDLNLLPYYFKLVGFILLGLVIAMAVFSIIFDFLKEEKVMGEILKSFFLLALLLIALSKEKEEDELILRIRLIAFAGSFMFGVGMVIIDPFSNFIFGGDFVSNITTMSVLFLMFFFYFFIFFWLKRKR